MQSQGYGLFEHLLLPTLEIGTERSQASMQMESSHVKESMQNEAVSQDWRRQ